MHFSEVHLALLKSIQDEWNIAEADVKTAEMVVHSIVIPADLEIMVEKLGHDSILPAFPAFPTRTARCIKASKIPQYQTPSSRGHGDLLCSLRSRIAH
jgi:hypothetical protein